MAAGCEARLAMTRRSWLMMGGAAAVWGASYMFIKVALDDFSEGAIVCIRTALGALVLLALARRWDALAPLRGRWPWVAAIAFVQVVIPFLLITFGENHIESQLAGILVSAAPIFTALLALGFDHDERSQGWAAVGSSSACSGSSCSSGSTCRAAATSWSAASWSSAPACATRSARCSSSTSCPALRPSGSPEARWPWRRSPHCRCAWPTSPTTLRASRPPAARPARRGGHGHRLPVVLHPALRDRTGARIGHRLHRPGLQRRLRRGPARRGLQRRRHRRARAHPGRLVAGGRGPAKRGATARAGARVDAAPVQEACAPVESARRGTAHAEG